MQEGPLGEEGKEIKPAELANMPLESAPQLIQPAAAAVVVEKTTGEIQVDIKESIAAPAADAIAKNE
jgi:hypothetical protein